jgi:predicted acylesterase/phospholipase RssA
MSDIVLETNNEIEATKPKKEKKISLFNYFKKFYLILSTIKLKFDEWIDKKERKIILRRLIENANTYDDWRKYSLELDNLEGKNFWKDSKESTLYHWKEVEKLIKVLQKKREIKDVIGLTHYIRVNLMKNLYSTSNPSLYGVCNVGTKNLIEEYQEEMIKSLEYIANFNERIFPLYKKLEFFSETRHAYGRTALLLSGGAALGMFHLGVVKTLYELNLLPRIVCGSSAGSIVGALMCTQPIETIPILIERDLKLGPFEYKDKKFSFLRKILRYITRGVLLDVEVLKEFLRENVGDITFQEAYDKTGWILNITVTGYKEHDNHRLLNYLTAPNVLIWSASCASSCVPTLFDPVQLLCKNEYGQIVPYSSNKSKFIDGSIMADLPMQRMSELFNVNTFIVSQVNPMVIPFLDQDDNKEFFNTEKNKFNFWRLLKNLLFSEIKHRCQQIQSLGILPNSLSKILNIITQDYRGHVTIFPVPKITDYLSVLSNPTKESIQYCCKHSAKRTFPS